jgi:hypothetical protein
LVLCGLVASLRLTVTRIPATLPPGKRICIYFVGGLEDPRACKDRCATSRPLPDSITGTSIRFESLYRMSCPCPLFLTLNNVITICVGYVEVRTVYTSIRLIHLGQCYATHIRDVPVFSQLIDKCRAKVNCKCGHLTHLTVQ